MRFALYWPLSTLDTPPSSLPCHGDPQPLFRTDEVIGVIFAEIDLHPVDFAAKPTSLRSIIARYWSAAFIADIRRLVGGKDHRHGALDTALADLVAVVVKRDIAAFG